MHVSSVIIVSLLTLTVAATSVPCERVFSDAGNIVTKCRAALDPDHVNTLTCLKSWLKQYRLGLTYSEDLPCAAKPVSDGYVCVCNSTYCDTTESPVKLPVGKYVQYTTSSTSPGFTKSTGDFQRLGTSNTGTLFIVNSSITYQEFKGIGGSFTDLFVTALSNLSKSTQDNLLRSFFSDQGVEYTIVRVPIAGCDYSVRIYTYDDVPGDVKLKHFSLTDEDYKYKIPFLKKAAGYSKRGLLLFGSAWTAPGWMKTNSATRPGYLLNQYYKPWANYHIKFLDAYAKEGIHFWGLTTGNEPIASFFVHFDLNNLIMMPEEQRTWIKQFLGPALKKSKHSVKLITLDDERPFVDWWMDTIMKDKEVADYIDGVALHWYFDGNVSPEMLNVVHNKYPDKFVIYTESNMLMGGDLGSWYSAASFISSIIENLNHWSIGYLCWNIALSIDAQPIRISPDKQRMDNLEFNFDFAPIMMNSTSDEFYKEPAFYALGHFSKFMPMDSVIIDVRIENNTATNTNQAVNLISVSDNNPPPPTPGPWPQTTLSPLQATVMAVASKNPDGSRTIIIYNPSEKTTMATIRDQNRGDISVLLSAESINSFIYW